MQLKINYSLKTLQNPKQKVIINIALYSGGNMLNIIYQCQDYIVCQKPIGISSQKSDTQEDMINLISKELNIPTDKVYPIHRLDMPVGGTMIYALNSKSAAFLSSLISQNNIKKHYLAIVHGVPQNDCGIMEDLLFKDSRTNKSYVVKRMRKGVKKASLEYKLLGSTIIDGSPISLVKILLHTGRTHQIRVQFSNKKMPLVGDRRYGSGKDKCTVALWSNTLELPDDANNSKPKIYSSYPDTDTFPWNCFFDIINSLK